MPAWCLVEEVAFYAEHHFCRLPWREALQAVAEDRGLSANEVAHAVDAYGRETEPAA